MHVRSAYCRGDRDAGIYSPHPQAEARISGSRSADMPEPPLASEVLTVDLVLRTGQGIQRDPLTLWGGEGCTPNPGVQTSLLSQLEGH